MPQYTLTFAQELNDSLQVGDVAYAGAAITTNAGFNTVASYNQIGTVLQVDRATNQVVVDDPTGVAVTTANYIFFKKDDKVNFGRVLGYFAETKFVNNSTTQGEMFAASMGAFESRK